MDGWKDGILQKEITIEQRHQNVYKINIPYAKKAPTKLTNLSHTTHQHTLQDSVHRCSSD